MNTVYTHFLTSVVSSLKRTPSIQTESSIDLSKKQSIRLATVSPFFKLYHLVVAPQKPPHHFCLSHRYHSLLNPGLHELDPLFRKVTLENDRLKSLARDLKFHHDPVGTYFSFFQGLVPFITLSSTPKHGNHEATTNWRRRFCYYIHPSLLSSKLIEWSL